MSSGKLEFLVVVPGLMKSDLLENLHETARLCTDIAEEIKNAMVKCKTIKQIDGNPISITGLIMVGIDSVKNIEVTYNLNGKDYKKIYSKQKFYEL